MIAIWPLIRQLQIEKSKMRYSGHLHDYVLGFMFAIDVAIRIIKDMQKSENLRRAA